MAVQIQLINLNENAEQSRANALEKDQGLFIRVVEQSDGSIIIILKDNVIVVGPPQASKEEGKKVEKGNKPSKKFREKVTEFIAWLNVGIFFFQYLPAIVDFLTRIKIEIIIS